MNEKLKRLSSFNYSRSIVYVIIYSQMASCEIIIVRSNIFIYCWIEQPFVKIVKQRLMIENFRDPNYLQAIIYFDICSLRIDYQSFNNEVLSAIQSYCSCYASLIPLSTSKMTFGNYMYHTQLGILQTYYDSVPLCTCVCQIQFVSL